MNEERHKPTAIELQTALRDPKIVFETPEEVASRKDLTRENKLKILRRWEYDARNEEVAEEEGMAPTGAEDLLGRILKALQDLGDTSDGEDAPNTKQ